MAQWSRADRTLYTKIVYYGPAFGGKTTNLESLHAITDPEGRHQLLTLKTSSDRTIFFDLLPFDLGEVLGYHVGMKLYTVPGQVRYDTTRQVVLAGADAIVFVADSSESRAEQNRWSLQNLKMNMRAKRLDPTNVPILFQFNKQDLPDAATPRHVAAWLGIPASKGIPACATEGRGVLETFIAGSRAMLQRLVALADARTRKEIDVEQLNAHIDRAFEPYRGRVADASRTAEPADVPGLDPAEAAARAAGGPEGAGSGAAAGRDDATTSIVLDSDDLLHDSVAVSVTLAERLAAASSRGRRLESEAEAQRRLVETLRRVGASFDPAHIVDAVLSAAAETLRAPVVAFLVREDGGPWTAERVLGARAEPLLDGEAGEAGPALVARLLDRGEACATSDLRLELGGADPEGDARPEALRRLRAVAGVPVDADGRRALLAYAAEPDGAFRPEDERFMATLAGQLAVGLEKARLYVDQERRGALLERRVAERTRDLERAYDDLRQLDRLKDRFLANVSHEMKTPLTAILSAGAVLRDYAPDAAEREEMVGTVLDAAAALDALLDNLFRLVDLERDAGPLEVEELDAAAVLRDAIDLSGHPEARFHAELAPCALTADRPRIARALANLFDNAVKFSGPDVAVDVRLEPAELERDGRTCSAVAISVLDRGTGVAEDDRARIFNPLEQGGDIDTAKPHGLGLGLHEARIIAERHGGALDYLPREGGGSRFRIVLPVRADGPGADPKESR